MQWYCSFLCCLKFFVPPSIALGVSDQALLSLYLKAQQVCRFLLKSWQKFSVSGWIFFESVL